MEGREKRVRGLMGDINFLAITFAPKGGMETGKGSGKKKKRKANVVYERRK